MGEPGVHDRTGGWGSVADWSNLEAIRTLLANGADPDFVFGLGGRGPMDIALHYGTPQVFAELARHCRDVDTEIDGRTWLWMAVVFDKPDHARALVAVGADPWRAMMSGWSPGRLNLASAEPGLFGPPPPGVELSEAEHAAVARAHRMIDALAGLKRHWYSFSCVAGVDAAEAVRRLQGTPAAVEEPEPNYFYDEEDLLIVGVTDVPGGCVVTQPWSYGASTPVVNGLLSAGTSCYAVTSSPTTGINASSFRDGIEDGTDLCVGEPMACETTGDEEETLRAYLYRKSPVGYSCDRTGLAPTDSRAFTGPPDIWIKLPARDYWKWV